MTPSEANQAIVALADGIDPETGEILPEQSVFNNPAVIRALYVAQRALEREIKREQRASSLPPNAGLPWTDEEDQELLAAFDAGTPIKDIARRHERTQGAITARLVRHGKISEPDKV